MLIATSPRLCSDQEKNSNEEVDSPIEVDCMSSKCIYDNCVGKRGEVMKEEQSWLVQNSQPAHDFMTDRITTKWPREFINSQKTNVSKNPVEPKLMQLDIPSPTQQAREFEGEEFLYYTQPAKAPSEELYNSLKTDVQNDLGNFLQSVTVKSDESSLITPTVQPGARQHLLKLPDVSSILGNAFQKPSAQSPDYIGHSPVSVSTSDKLHTFKTVQLSETVKSPIKATFQSEGSWKPSYAGNTPSDGHPALEHSAVLHLEGTPKSSHVVSGQSMTSSHTDNLDEFCSLAEICDVRSVKDLQHLQDKSVKSDGQCDTLYTEKEQPEDVCTSSNTSAVQSKEYGYLSNAPSSHTVKSCASTMAQPVQIEDHFNLQPPVTDETRQAKSCSSKVPYQSLKAKAECPQSTKALEKHQDCAMEPTRKSPTQFAESYSAEQASTGNSEEIYLSCGSHWSDSVTANKVAVEGDLMASIIKVKRNKGTLLLFCHLK